MTKCKKYIYIYITTFRGKTELKLPIGIIFKKNVIDTIRMNLRKITISLNVIILRNINR